MLYNDQNWQIVAQKIFSTFLHLTTKRNFQIHRYGHNQVLFVTCCNALQMFSRDLLFAGKVTFQEFRKLPTAAMDDYMNKLKESSPIHRERNSNQTWLHQGKFADKIMQKLRARWVLP